MASTISTSSISQYSGLLSGQISFTGLGSGTDFQEVVDKLVEVESINKNRLELWKSDWEAKITSMESLNQRLEAIEEGAAAMDTESEFMVRQASSSNSSLVSATASSEAHTGAYSVTVGTDIKHVVSTSGVASSSTVIAGAAARDAAAKDLVFEVDGTSYTISVDPTDTLEDLRDKFNAVVGSPVSAEIESDGTSSNAYHLRLTSNTGGSDGRIVVTQNPTDLSFGFNDHTLEDDSAWTATSAFAVAGNFTGDSASAEQWRINVAVNTGGGAVTVGSGSFDLDITITDGNTGAAISTTTITVPADYTPGDSIDIGNGLYVQLESGEVNNGDQFDIRAFASDIDDAEAIDWTGPAITTSGNYIGSIAKTYSFAVVSGGDIDSGGTQDTVILRWTDSSGRTGTVSIADSDLTYDVDQGVKIKLDAGTITGGDTFQINVFSPDEQQGQDRGLAQVTKLVHSGFSDSTTTAVTTTDGTFTYTYAGQTVTVDVPAGITLTQLKSLINDASDNPGVVASILNDGKGLPDSYKLVLTGEDSGAQYQITDVHHTLDNFSSGGDVGGGFTRTQLATNSMIQVDGFPTGDEYLQRSNNQVSDVIGGVTLNLHDAGTAQVTVSTNTASIIANIEAFINAVNYAQSFIRQETHFDEDGEDTGVLIGNYTYYILKSRIDSVLNTSVPGLDGDTDAYINLAQIGITTDPDADGAWVIDETKLTNALNSNLEAVANLFINNTAKGTQGVAKRMYDEMVAQTDSETGSLNVLIKNYNNIIDNIDKKIESEEKRLASFEEHQLERFARLEGNMAELNALSASIESQISNLPSSNSSK